MSYFENNVHICKLHFNGYEWNRGFNLYQNKLSILIIQRKCDYFCLRLVITKLHKHELIKIGSCFFLFRKSLTQFHASDSLEILRNSSNIQFFPLARLQFATLRNGSHTRKLRTMIQYFMWKLYLVKVLDTDITVAIYLHVASVYNVQYICRSV